MSCPRCHQGLVATADRVRATAFSYWRCPGDEGRATTFFDFLREKNFVKPLSPERLAELRPRPVAALSLVALGMAPVALLVLSYVHQLGLGPRHAQGFARRHRY